MENVTQPVKIERDEFGLIKGVNYVFKDGGRRVDWRAMIPKEYLVPNRANFIKKNQTVPETIEGLEDKDLLILLDGIKYVADLRGYLNSVPAKVVSSPDHCTVVWEILWLPNFETEGLTKTYGDTGDANSANTNGFGRLFLGPIAANRAFVRAVRNFLRIEILGKDEVSENEPVSATSSGASAEPVDAYKNRAITTLKNLMTTKGVTLDHIKEKLVKEGNADAANISAIEQFDNPTVLNLIERLTKLKPKSK